jgi:hypothetical protein
MSAIDWKARTKRLGAVPIVAGIDAKLRRAMIARLESAGAPYDAAREAIGNAVDAAKAAGDMQFADAVAAWAASASSVHDQAGRFARFILGGVFPISFDSGAGAAALANRLVEAQAQVQPGKPKAALAADLQAHADAVESASAGRPEQPTYAAPFTTPQAHLVGLDGSHVRRALSLPDFERFVLQPLVDEADLLISELTS